MTDIKHKAINMFKPATKRALVRGDNLLTYWEYKNKADLLEWLKASYGDNFTVIYFNTKGNQYE